MGEFNLKLGRIMLDTSVSFNNYVFGKLAGWDGVSPLPMGMERVDSHGGHVGMFTKEKAAQQNVEGGKPLGCAAGRVGVGKSKKM